MVGFELVFKKHSMDFDLMLCLYEFSFKSIASIFVQSGVYEVSYVIVVLGIQYWGYSTRDTLLGIQCQGYSTRDPVLGIQY